MTPHPLEAAQPDHRPDDTPVRTYVVRLSDRQVGNLKSLLGRNFAGLTLGVANEFGAIAEAVKQICAEENT